MRLDLGLIADAASIDSQGKLYILGEFRYLWAKSFPTIHPKMALILRISAPLVEVRELKALMAIEAVDDDGSPLLPRVEGIEIQFAPVGPANRGMAHAQIVLDLNGIPIQKPGDFTFHLWVNNARVGEVGIHVIQAEEKP